MQRFTKKSFLTSAFCVIILTLIAAVCTQTDFNNPVDRSGDNFTCPEWFEYGHSCEPPTDTVFTLTTNALPSNVGFVNPSAMTTYNSGAEVSATATAAIGWRFVGWSGTLPDGVDASNEIITVVMNHNITLIANFTPDTIINGNGIERELTVNAHPQFGGSVDPAGTTAHVGGTMVKVTATPNEGYEFAGWTGDLSLQEPEITFAINSNMMLAANFCEIGKCGVESVVGSCTNLATHDCENDVAREDCGVGFSFAANEQCPTLYRVIVINGAAPREYYREGETVIIEAHEPPTDYIFSRWISNDVDEGAFNNPSRAATTFVMPAHDVVVEATRGTTPHPPVYGSCTEDGVCRDNVESRDCNGVFVENGTCPIIYTITCNGCIASPNRSEAGRLITITANAPPAEQEFREWTSNGVTSFASANTPTSFTMPASNVTVSANFGCIRGTNCPDDPGACRVSGDCDNVRRDTCGVRGGVFSAERSENFNRCPITYEVIVIDGSAPQARYHSGDTVRITANNAPANQGFTGWTTASNGVTFRPSETSQPAWFIMPANAVTVRANYRRIDTLAVCRTPTAGGDVNVNGVVNPTTASTLIEGTSVTISATANTNPLYRFDRWTAATGSLPPSPFNANSAANTFNINGNVNICANFVQRFTLDASRNFTDRGNVRVNNGANNPTQSTHDAGTQITVTATRTNTNFIFNGWTPVTGSLPSGGVITTAADSSTSTITFNINSNVNIMANFLPRHTVLVSRNQTTWGDVNVNPPNVNNPTTSSTHTEGTQITITATQRSGYGFVNWTAVSGSLPTGFNANSQTNTFNINSNINIRANFGLIHTLTTAANPTAGGNVTVTPPPSHTPNGYLNGTSVTVTANANAGYRFNNWTHVSGTLPTGFSLTNPTNTFNINANVSIRANFVQICALTVNATPTAGGTTTPSGTTTYDCGTTVNVCATSATATSTSAFAFTAWSGASASTNICTSILMDGNKTLTARFHPTRFRDARDGEIYNAVRIGNLTWMAENLRHGGTTGAWCYNGDPSLCVPHGRLYTWATATTTACPAGWRLPGSTDWNDLFAAVGGAETAGRRLRSETGWELGSSSLPGTNDFGFSALPGGYRLLGINDGQFAWLGIYGGWWSATEGNATSAQQHYILTDHGDSGIRIITQHYDKNGEFSVRCVQN